MIQKMATDDLNRSHSLRLGAVFSPKFITNTAVPLVIKSCSDLNDVAVKKNGLSSKHRNQDFDLVS